MMKTTTFAAALAVIVAAGLPSAEAQSLRSAPVPAEFPPSSFRGTQYVDSAGCVFIRAGIDGNTTWVPRVNRARRQICDQTPTNAGTAVAAAPAEAPAAQQITIEPPAPAATPAAQPAPARVAQETRQVRSPAPRAQAPAVAVAPTPAPAPAPARVIARVPPPAPAQPAVRRAEVAAANPAKPPARQTAQQAAPEPAPAAKTVVARQPACQGASPISSRYINSGARLPVRCGPQALNTGASQPARVVQRPATQTVPQASVQQAAPRRAALAQNTSRVSQGTRVLPRAAYDARVAEQDVMQPPAGYRPVWTDDRLNPRRAEQSLGGIARSRLVWTQTVPRRLIDQSTGRDVTAEVALVYPYTDRATQQRELGTVTLVRRDGQILKKIKRHKARAAAPAPQRHIAAPKAASRPQATGSGRFVQVGTYGVPANAQRAAQTLARAGLPARIGKVTRGGKAYQVVLAGPFNNSAVLSNGLQVARGLGYSDAFVR